MFDKTKSLGLAIGPALGKMTGDAPEAPPYDEEALDAIADELLKSVHSHDKRGLVEALKSFIDCIQSADAILDGEGSEDSGKGTY